MLHNLTCATPADHAALADVMFDAVRNGPSLYTEAQRKSLAAKPLSVALPRTRSGAYAVQTQSIARPASCGLFCWFCYPQREMRVRSGPYGLWSSA